MGTDGNGNGTGNGDWLGVLKARYPKGVPKRLREFFRAYGEEARRDATKAAEIAGYAHANAQGNKLKAKWPNVIEMRSLAYLESCGVKPNELLEHLSEIVRDKDHKDRMKAIELNAKVHGMLSEKIIHDFDRNSLMKQIDNRISQLMQARALESGQALDVETPEEPSS